MHTTFLDKTCTSLIDRTPIIVGRESLHKCWYKVMPSAGDPRLKPQTATPFCYTRPRYACYACPQLLVCISALTVSLQKQTIYISFVCPTNRESKFTFSVWQSSWGCYRTIRVLDLIGLDLLLLGHLSTSAIYSERARACFAKVHTVAD
jgi:hypothetical protein